MQQRCHHASASARSPSWPPMPRPRLQRAATARREKVQLRIREQSVLCDRLCLVLVCRGRYGLGGGFLLFILGSSLDGVGPVRGLRGGGRGGWCEDGPGAARTILLFHTISARPPKQPCMVRTFLKVHTRPRLANALWCRGY
jgi:hypothetical protein